MPFEPLHNEIILLRDLQRDSDEAFTALYDAYAEPVYSMALIYLKQPLLAEDVVQTVFLKCWEKRAELAGLDSFTSWLFIVTRNEAFGMLRKQASEQTYRAYIKQRMELAEELPELEQMQDQVTKLLQEAVAQLPPQQQRAFRLQREEGSTYEQIAESMGIAVNTVRKHLHLALTALREYVRERANGKLVVLVLLLSQL